MTYLQRFLEWFSYSNEDTAVLCEALERIDGCQKASLLLRKALAHYRSAAPCSFEEILRLADDAAVAAGVHEYTAELLVCILMSETLRERYRERGLADALFAETMCDLRYKLEECKAVKGIVGTFVGGWFAGFFELTRFALGRLQFELVPFEATYEKDGKRLCEGDPVINVHIPRDGSPLDSESCEQAYREAADFFRPQIAGHVAFVCFSWLLDPQLVTVLPPQSNIRRFASRYTLIRSGVYKESPDLWRLFDTDERHPDRLPQDTTARRCVASHLKSGGKLGWGYGVFFAE